MAFKAYTYDMEHPTEYTDADVYEFLEGGVLEIRPTEDSGKSRTYYAPHKWELISADHNHKPGSAGGNYDVRRSVL